MVDIATTSFTTKIDSGETISEAKIDQWIQNWVEGKEASFPKATKS